MPTITHQASAGERPAEPIPILVVDDERDIRDGCERILGRMGCIVSKATCGEEALQLMEGAQFAILLLDLKMPGMDGMEVLQRIRERNQNILVIVITGYATLETAVEAMKKGAYDFIPKPFTPDQLRLGVRRALEKHRLTLETAALQKERRQTLADLGREQSRIRTIIESLPNGVVVTDDKGRVVLMNPSFSHHLGLNREQRPGNEIEFYFKDPGFCKLVRQLSQGSIDTNEDPPTYEFSPREEKYLMARGRTVWGEDQRCQGAVVVLTDITTVKVLDRLKSEFVAKVSHELRSPLSTIHEQLTLVLKKLVGEEDDGEQHILSRAKEKTVGLITLIGDLLDLSRIESGVVCPECRPVSVAELLQNIVDFLNAKAQSRSQTLLFECQTSACPLIEADPLALESVFGNLITNAIHYTPEGGEIRVILGIENGELSVAVKDNGFGIETAHLAKIFGKFYRVKTDQTRYITGTGLGLSIVKGLLDTMGGSIVVDSQPRLGSTFTVRLPLQAPDQGPA